MLFRSCYALYFERGRVDGSLFNASPSVRLDSTSWYPFDRDTVRHAFRSMLALTQSHGPFYGSHGSRPPFRAADSLTDSIRLSFTDGFSGAVFVLSAPAGRTDTLGGRVFERWDAGPPFETPRGAARAIREPCK